MEKIRVLLVGDHMIVRQGLKALLEIEPDIVVVGAANDGCQAVYLAKKLLPEVVLMNISMPMLNDLETARQIIKEAPGARMLALSSNNDDEYVRQLTETGATGYLLKHTNVAGLIKAVREAKKGNACFSLALSKRLIKHYCEGFLSGKPRWRGMDRLTARELEVWQLIAKGLANKQIAVGLFISIKTVEKHRQSLMDKLNIHNVAGLTRHAISQGVFERSVALQV